MKESEFKGWLEPFSLDQKESLASLRSLILEHTQGLNESINEGKWLNNYVFYSRNESMVFAIGPKGKSKITFHMMPFYGSPELQKRHGEALSPFLSGKSCIAFRSYSELPIASLVNILEFGILSWPN